jgi:hypothetical protein
MRVRIASAATAALALLLISTTAAEAYLGPGAGLSAIGSVVSVISAVFLAIVGFIWYPIKRLFKRVGSLTASRRTDAGAGIEPAGK